MEQSKIDKLKLYCHQFYLNEGVEQGVIDDKEFDSLRKEYELEFGSIKNLIDWPKGLNIENIPENKVDKTVVTDNNLSNAVIEDLTNCEVKIYYCNLKYDGGALKLTYDRLGRLQRVQSTPFADMGIVRTEQFYDLVPHQIDPAMGIQCIRCEVLVDADVWGRTARNKANGLINSVESQDEIQHEAFIRYYLLQYFDGNWEFKRHSNDLINLMNYEIIISRERVVSWDGNNPIYCTKVDKVFGMAKRFLAEESPTNSLIKLGDEPTFQCDGVVVYCEDYVYAYKFYYTDSKITTVNDIRWQDQPNGGWSAVISIDPIELDGKYIQKASSNGVPNMISMKIGIGSKVKVILAGTTIPKIVEVLEPSEEFNFPTCECGYKLTADDIFGSTIKCGNQNLCTRKLKCFLRFIINSLVEDDWWTSTKGEKSDIFQNIFEHNPEWVGELFMVDRFNPSNALKYPLDYHFGYDYYGIISSRLIKCISIQEPIIKDTNEDINLNEVFKDLVSTLYNFTDLQWANFEINAESLRIALFILKYWNKENFINAKKVLDQGEPLHIRETKDSEDFVIL